MTNSVCNYYWNMHFQPIENIVNTLISLIRDSTRQINIFQQIKTHKQLIEILGNCIEKQN